MNELEVLVSIQDKLLKISSENIETIIYQIKGSCFNTFSKYSLLIKIIFEIVFKKRNIRQYLSIFCKLFSESHKNKKKPNEFKHIFLSKFLKIDSFNLGNIHSQIHFYFLCISNKFLTNEEVIDQIRLTVDSNIATNAPCVIYYILLYFAPILKNLNNKYYRWLCDQFEHNIKLVIDYPKSLLRHWGHLPERLLWINECIIQNRNKIMDKEEWNERENILANGVFKNSIESIIINDNVDKLQEFIVNKNFEIDNYKCKDSFLVFQELFEMNDILMLPYSATFKSIHCFKYLILNKSKSDSFYNDLMIYSIKGGCPEIIRILYQRNFTIENCLNTSFIFFDYGVFQWIYQMGNKNEEEFVNETIKKDDIFSFSLHSLLLYYENKIKDKFNPENDQLIQVINKKLHES